MTTNAMIRLRSKSISDVFAASEWEEDKEDLIPKKEKDDSKKSAFEKWKSSLNLNIRNSDEQQRRTSRANSIFNRPPPPTHRRQSIAVTFRRPSVIKDDLKKMWENRRASLTSLKTQIKDKITGRSNDNLATHQDGRPTRIEDDSESQFDDRYLLNMNSILLE
uniref:FH2 domain-containing protein n=1 Tax=Caenorhabditis tropicalis TaxID=1561998 RepID=A0A1I7U8A7_9PELO